MESPSRALSLAPSPAPPHTLSHSNSLRRRRISNEYSPNSPEFEFWGIGRNPVSLPEPALHSADELFSDGFLLPLHLLHHHTQPPSDLHDPDPDPKLDPEPEPEPESSPAPESSEQSNSSASITSAGNSILTASKRWKEIFKRGEKNRPEGNSDETNKKSGKAGKKREKKNAGNNGNNGGNGSSNNNNGGNSSSAELNINIWPFSRSRSAGNNLGRSRPAASCRKVSSAPCSRSNSSGESKSSRRSWPNSPGRTRVHLGRTSPVWQVRRNRAVSEESRRAKQAANNAAGGKGRVLNLNVPLCIGYRQQLSCRSEETNGGEGCGSVGGAARSGGGDGSGNNGNLFSLRGLFSKKSVLTA